MNKSNELAKKLKKYFTKNYYQLEFPQSIHFLSDADFVTKDKEISGTPRIAVDSLGFHAFSKEDGHKIWIRKTCVRIEYAIVSAIFHEMVHSRNRELQYQYERDKKFKELREIKKKNEKIAIDDGLKLASNYLRVGNEHILFAQHIAALLCPALHLKRNSSLLDFSLFVGTFLEFFQGKTPEEMNKFTSTEIDSAFKILGHIDVTYCHNMSNNLQALKPIICKMDEIICNRIW